MSKLKNYQFVIKLEFGQIEEAKSKKQAIEQVKESFLDEFNIRVEDNEIEHIKKPKKFRYSKKAEL